MKHYWLLLAPLLALQGCAAALIGAGGTAAVSTAFERRTTSAIFTDENMALTIGDRITGRFGSLTHVNVAPYNRVVLLTGEAPDEQTRAAIEADVRDIANVRGVVNEIQIGPPSSFGDRANDSLITTKVKTRFLDANKFNPVHVKVVTEAGVVYLLGIVTEQEANDAVEIARTTGGVIKVVKMFSYCQPTEELCRPTERPSVPASPGA
ncbi:MAG TPA: BON domain-containing protein [Burkholderiales bacterium]